jgi:asparagine synthase (glutamine-hydrolysing)
MFAGIVKFAQSSEVSNANKLELKSSLSRHSKENILTLDIGNIYLVRANTGAIHSYGGLLNNKSYISALAGEPIIGKPDIMSDHIEITRSFQEADYTSLKHARGNYATATVTNLQSGPIIYLSSDRLGIRPLYYYFNETELIFSTSLRVIEKINFVPKKPDSIGLSQYVGLGYPLGERTQYENIYQLRGGEIVKFGENGLSKFIYWDWAQLKASTTDMPSMVKKSSALFLEAIQARLQHDDSALAFLSGGMDSRAIVSGLINCKAKVSTFNFSPKKSMDFEFAKKYAEKSNIPFYSRPVIQNKNLDFRVTLARVTSELISSGKFNASRPRALWSGDGGSVCLGTVYMDEALIKILRDEGLEAGIDYFLSKNRISIPINSFTRASQKKLGACLKNSIREECNKYHHADKAQIFFLFLIMNDQRRHLNDFYEDLDIHRLEYHLPFFDSTLLEYIFKIPIEYRINHYFYNDLFKTFTPPTNITPWQTYPGHIPCNIISPNDKAKYQWDISQDKPYKKTFLEGVDGIKLSFSIKGIGPISKVKLLIASIVHLFALANSKNVIKAAKIYRAYS